MAKPSSTVKRRYNQKAYDRICLDVLKGQKEKIRARANALNKSVNGYITGLIKQDMGDTLSEPAARADSDRGGNMGVISLDVSCTQTKPANPVNSTIPRP